jgi:hypothetical protein
MLEFSGFVLDMGVAFGLVIAFIRAYEVLFKKKLIIRIEQTAKK